jgi:hypothetical protein
MPHVIVKLWPGKYEHQKTRLTEEIVKDVMEVLNYGEECRWWVHRPLTTNTIEENP